MDNAIHALRLEYTYDILQVTPEKKEARKRVGSMAADLLVSIRDDIIEAAIVRWHDSKS